MIIYRDLFRVDNSLYIIKRCMSTILRRPIQPCKI